MAVNVAANNSETIINSEPVEKAIGTAAVKNGSAAAAAATAEAIALFQADKPKRYL